MSLSIVMPVFNQARFMNEALSGIYNQTYKQIELIIVLVHGDKDCIKIAKRQKPSKSVKKVKVLFSNYAMITHQHNLGFLSAKGKYMSMHCSDDFTFPDSYKSMIKLAMYKNAVVVYSGFYFTDYMLKNRKLYAHPGNIPDPALVKRKEFLKYLPERFSEDKYRILRIFEEMQANENYKKRIVFYKKPTFLYRQHKGEIHRHKRFSQKYFSCVSWGSNSELSLFKSGIKSVNSIREIGRDDYCVYFTDPQDCIKYIYKVNKKGIAYTNYYGFKRLIVHWQQKDVNLISKFLCYPHVHNVTHDANVWKQLILHKIPNAKFVDNPEKMRSYLAEEDYVGMGLIARSN